MPRSGRPKPALSLTDAEREALLQCCQTRRGGRAAALRARVVLACSEGRNNRDVAQRMGLAEHTVGKWRRRFVAARLEGLRDRRSGPGTRPHPRAQLQVARLCELALALSQRAVFGPWSLGQALQNVRLQPSTRANVQAFTN